MTPLHASKNKVCLAVAGAGKTTKIVEDVLSKNISKRIAIITYTNKAVASIIEKIKERNYGVIPSKVEVYTWYNFLYNQCVLPYQKTMFNNLNLNGLTFEGFYGPPILFAKTDRKRYITKHDRLRAKYCSEFVDECINKATNLIDRLSQIYEEIVIDEVQDLNGEDLDFIENLIDSNIRITLVGDSRQSTFTTHTSIRKKKYKGIKIYDYFCELHKNGKIELLNWIECFRSNKEICAFADKLFPSLMAAESKMELRTGHDGVFLLLEKDVTNYISYLNILGTKCEFLKYDSKTKTHYQTQNFGECKGLTFDRTIIFTNGPLSKFISDFTCISPAKYYVGLTRARYSVTIVVNSFPKNNAYRDIELSTDKMKILVKEFII